MTRLGRNIRLQRVCVERDHDNAAVALLSRENTYKCVGYRRHVNDMMTLAVFERRGRAVSYVPLHNEPGGDLSRTRWIWRGKGCEWMMR